MCDVLDSLCSRRDTELGDVTPHNIRQLRTLNTVVFPVTYNDKVKRSIKYENLFQMPLISFEQFYKDVLELGELAKLGKCGQIVVCLGVLVCFLCFTSVLQ